EYKVRFDNVSGLLPRTPVEYAGIRVGHVHEIRLEDGIVTVVIRVTPELTIYDDTQVGLETRGLLGEKIIMMEDGGSGAVIPPGGMIQNTQSARTFDEAIESFGEVSKAVRDLLKGGEGKPSIQ